MWDLIVSVHDHCFIFLLNNMKIDKEGSLDVEIN